MASISFYTFLNGNLFYFALCTKSQQNAVVFAYICVSDGQLIAINDEQMKVLVMYGTRLPLDSIKGPADLRLSAKMWIDRCWQDSPDERPSFDSKLSPCVVDVKTRVLPFYVFYIVQV